MSYSYFECRNPVSHHQASAELDSFFSVSRPREFDPIAGAGHGTELGEREKDAKEHAETRHQKQKG